MRFERAAALSSYPGVFDSLKVPAGPELYAARLCRTAGPVSPGRRERGLAPQLSAKSCRLFLSPPTARDREAKDASRKPGQLLLRYASITSERLCSLVSALSNCSRLCTCKVVVMVQVLFLFSLTVMAVMGRPRSWI